MFNNEKEFKKGYIIHQSGNKTLLCKVLNEYDAENEAEDNLIKLLTNKTTEKELLKDYSKKESW